MIARHLTRLGKTPLGGKLQLLGAKVWHSPTLMTWLSLAARTFGLVVLTPILIFKLPTPEVGVWLLFQAIVSLQTVADFGFGATFSRVVAYTLSGIQSFAEIPTGATRNEGRLEREPNNELLNQVLCTMRVVYHRLALVAVVMASCFGTLVLYRPISATASPVQCWFAWTILLAGLYVTFWATFVVSYLQGLNKIAVFRRWESTWSIAGVLATSAVALLGGGLSAITATYQLFAVVAVLWNYRIAASLNQNLLQRTAGGKLSTEVFQYVWPAAWRSGLGAGLALLLMHHGPGILYAQFGDPASSVGFLLAMRLMVAIAQISNVPFLTKIPVIARDFAAGSMTEVNRKAVKGMQHSYLAFLVAVCSVGTVAYIVLAYAEKQDEFVTLNFWFLMSVGFFLERVGSTNLQLYSLSNNILWHTANGISGLIYILSVSVLWSFGGAFAFPIGMIIAYVFFYTPFALGLTYRLFGLRDWRKHEWDTYALPILLTLVSLLIILAIVRL